MNCLDFHRAVNTDPRRLDVAALHHLRDCSACGTFYAHALEQEERLERALRVPAPEGLASRIVARAAFGRSYARWLALAASVLAAAVGAGWFVAAPRPDPLALAGIDFVVYEEAQSIVDAKPADRQVLARVAREMGVSLPEQLGRISYICVYPLAGDGAHHLVVSTPLGKLTVLLFPERSIASRTITAARGLQAAVVPAARGAVAIIGRSAESVTRAEAILTSG